MTYSVFLVSTLTGDVGARLPVAGSGEWSDVVNDATGIKATVPTPWLLRQPRDRWAAWAGSLLVCWDGTPVALGPILPDLSDATRQVTTLTAGGLWSLLDGRMVTDQDRTDGKNLAESVVALKEGSLGTIGRRIVELVQRRPNGWLPLRYASPEENGTEHQRTYEGFNLGNNTASKRLKELSEVIEGPDFAFRPEWVPGMEGVRVQWAMYHGTRAMPEIDQQHVHVLDLTAKRSKAVATKVTVASDEVTRVYATGAGQDRGTLIRVLSDPVTEGLPWRETVLADTQVENADLLVSKGRGRLEAGRQVQLSLTVSAHDFPPGSFWAGDAWEVHWPAGYPQLEAGTYRMRSIKRSGKLDSQQIGVEFQPEELLRAREFVRG